MPSVPVKPEYGPTLGSLLAPRWRGLSKLSRRTIVLAAVLLAAALAGIVLSLLDAGYSHGGPVSFSFKYRGLYRTAPQAGGYVRIVRRSPTGGLEHSLEVKPLALSANDAEPQVSMALYAPVYARSLQAQDQHFVFRGEGRTKVGSAAAYEVLYTTYVEGLRMYGRDIMMLPERRGADRGVVVAMQSRAGLQKQVAGPLEVGSTGLLQRPLRSFTLE